MEVVIQRATGKIEVLTIEEAAKLINEGVKFNILGGLVKE